MVINDESVVDRFGLFVGVKLEEKVRCIGIFFRSCFVVCLTYVLIL